MYIKCLNIEILLVRYGGLTEFYPYFSILEKKQELKNEPNVLKILSLTF